MSTIEIKEHLHEYIDQADERMLKLLYAMAQADMEEKEYELSEAHIKILDERIASHKADPEAGSSWEEVKSRIKGATI
ncbi:addiction module protein [Aquiflexum sp. TKW24L]|uniref:addiction module protein n=1 Tax=Aquiflexum sp. TKW24L TaxID=2942212 RepID=UPI0020BE0C9A|nr:addiction module protein [Aquiflexum sp. TKW24L]MCL6259017.1 addiction module protein [Aquiflexum sp. TKW24L]